MSKTPWQALVGDSPYIGAGDFKEGEEKTFTIASVNNELVQNKDGKEMLGVVHFQEKSKPLILNKTNSKAIQKATGSRFIEDWCGKVIQLYVDDNVKAFGEVVSAVRVRPFKPAVRQIPRCAKCGGEVKPAMGKGADYIAASTKKALGYVACYECYVKEMQAAQEAAREKEGADHGETEADG